VEKLTTVIVISPLVVPLMVPEILPLPLFNVVGVGVAEGTLVGVGVTPPPFPPFPPLLLFTLVKTPACGSVGLEKHPAIIKAPISRTPGNKSHSHFFMSFTRLYRIPFQQSTDRLSPHFKCGEVAVAY
jgi:hypothetical protein